MGKFSYMYFKDSGKLQVTAKDDWEYAIYSIWKLSGGIIDFRLSSKEELDKFDEILDQVYKAGQESTKQQIRDMIGV